MHVRSYPLLIALVAVAVLVLAPAALAGGALGTLGLMSWTATGFTASDGAAYDAYGHSVAIDGDTAVVGAPNKTVGALDAQGVVYVYTRSNGLWTLETTLTASDGEAYDHYGTSVALDSGTIAVGAPESDDLGAVYVYTRAGEGWAEVDELTTGLVRAGADDVVGKPNLGYGHSVSLDGTTLAVGAPGMDDDGAVYVYSWDSGQGAYALWAELTSGEATDGHQFGSSVCFNAGSGEYDLAVGAPGNVDVDGAVYLFDTLSDVWSMYQKVTEPQPAGAPEAVGGNVFIESGFGRAVSLRGDVLAVGSPVLLTAAPAPEDAVGFEILPGAAYVYHRHDGAWSAVGTLTNEDPGLNDGFGSSVAVSGELTVLVGAPGRDVDDDQRRGMVYAYDWTGQIYQEPYQLVASSGGQDDRLGSSLAVSEGQVLAGAPGATVGGNEYQGAAWLFTLPAPTVKVGGHSPGWQNAAEHLSFRGIEAEGGAAIDGTEYRIGAGDWKASARVTIKRQGATKVQFRAVDIFGTLGAVKTVTVRVDTQRPRVVARAATAKAGTIARMAFKVSDPRPSSGTALMRLVVRNAAGTEVTRASTLPVTTNAWHTVRIKALRLTPGVYTVLLQAMDGAGNIQNGATAATLTVR